MNKSELSKLNIGESLDWLMNIDPRGYGVCRILYEAARKRSGGPLSTTAAEKLLECVKDESGKGPDGTVFILTGFVLLPHKKAEMDGLVGSMLLARALAAIGAKPVVVCPEECLEAVKNLSKVVGLHLYKSIDDMNQYPYSMTAISFPKKLEEARQRTDELLATGVPSAVIAVECPGANRLGVYHNSTGMNVTELEAKTDILFDECKRRGAPSFAIGDLGNETGMAAIGDHIKHYIPYAADINETLNGDIEKISAKSCKKIIKNSSENTSAYERVNTSAYERVNASANKRVNTSAYERINASANERVNTSAYERVNASAYACENAGGHTCENARANADDNAGGHTCENARANADDNAGGHTCVCGCGGGIAAASAADYLITATISDWGCNALIAGLAFLCGDYEIMHGPEMQREAMIAASRSDLVDMTGRLAPSIDGVGLELNVSLATAMRECVKHAVTQGNACDAWFEKTLARGYFNDRA